MKYVAYIRVSTKQQGLSGLGLEAQQAAIDAFTASTGGVIVGKYIEVRSGQLGVIERSELANALNHARKENATLLVAKLDRLSRNVHFVSGLIQSGVDFIAVDMPSADKMMLQLFSVLGEYERDQISMRTKSALCAAKVRGTILGRAGRDNLKSTVEKRIALADEFAQRVKPLLADQLKRGLSRRSMMNELNSLNVKTSSGVRWSLTQVQRTVKRLCLDEA